jgi:hypothetical protein
MMSHRCFFGRLARNDASNLQTRTRAYLVGRAVPYIADFLKIVLTYFCAFW